ncbi:MAG: phosphatidate cytidylyltransferase [Clostridiales bacterium]|jgi:phosphatidate cytidylyltransferase|nr:phosphatidate cytidylyltransferase [Clostridia bacterium]MCR4883775.1 phosphatidate cytidylyltransferase [Clostridiales bacterium]
MVQRLVTASFMVVFGLLMIYFGGTVFAVGAILCFIFALREEYHALSVAGHRPVAWPTWVAMIVCVPMAAILKKPVFSPILMVTCLLTIALVIFRRDPHLEDGLMSLVPLFSVLLPGLCIVSLSQISPLSVQRTLIGLLIVVPVLGDTFAYIVGSHFGGPKLCPAVSPHKTISGAVGGLLGSMAGAMIIWLLAYLICAPTTQPMLPAWWVCLLIGFFGGIASQLGDLFASLIKRHCNIKDFSNLFPGHGGMMDRLDSLLFMAIVIYVYLSIRG